MDVFYRACSKQVAAASNVCDVEYHHSGLSSEQAGESWSGKRVGDLDIETSQHTAAVWVRFHASCMALPVSSL